MTLHKDDGDGAGSVDPLEGERLALMNLEAHGGESRPGEHRGREGDNGGDGELHVDRVATKSV